MFLNGRAILLFFPPFLAYFINHSRLNWVNSVKFEGILKCDTILDIINLVMSIFNRICSSVKLSKYFRILWCLKTITYFNHSQIEMAKGVKKTRFLSFLKKQKSKKNPVKYRHNQVKWNHTSKSFIN